MSIKTLAVVRVGIPTSIALVGIVLLFAGAGDSQQGAGVALIGVSVVVALLNFFFVMSTRDTEDRDREEAARDFYANHGHWPTD